MDKGKWWEEKSIEFLSTIHTGNQIFGERHIHTDYGEFRKIDISIGNPGDSDFVIFECKNWAKTIGPREVGEALDQMRDVQAKKVTLLVNGKVSNNAKKKASKRGIQIFSLIDPVDERLRPKLFSNVLAHFYWINRFKYSFWFAGSMIEIHGDPNMVMVEDGRDLVHLVQDRWNEKSINREPGIHTFIEGFHTITTPKFGVKIAAVDKIKIDYEVVASHFLHKVELNKGRGVFSVVDETFQPIDCQIGFGPVSIEEIVNRGIKVGNKLPLESYTFEQFAYFAG